jgi:hypothetical protein
MYSRKEIKIILKYRDLVIQGKSIWNVCVESSITTGETENYQDRFEST